MVAKLSAKCIKLLDFTQKNADEAINRKMDENLELLRLLNNTTEKLIAKQSEIESLKDITELAVNALDELEILALYSECSPNFYEEFKLIFTNYKTKIARLTHE